MLWKYESRNGKTIQILHFNADNLNDNMHACAVGEESNLKVTTSYWDETKGWMNAISDEEGPVKLGKLRMRPDSRQVRFCYVFEYTFQLLHHKGIGSNEFKCLYLWVRQYYGFEYWTSFDSHRHKHLTSFNPEKVKPNSLITFWVISLYPESDTNAYKALGH